MHFYFHSWHNFFYMGGYAAYIWSAYALVLLSLIGIYFFSKTKLNKILKIIRQGHADTA